MKKWLVTIAVVSALSACSASNESKQSAGDFYQKSSDDLPAFAPLATGGVTVRGASNEFALPPVKIKKADAVDIRPPSAPLAIINNSVTQFDGQRALIAFEPAKQAVYNLKQVERLLREQEISFKTNGNSLETEWTATGRADDIGDTQVRYLIEEVNAPHASALLVSVLEMKRDGTIYSPSATDRQRYSSDRLNQLVGQLNNAYRKQQQELAVIPVSQISSSFGQDTNGRAALLMSANFNQAWQKLSDKLPQLGFKWKDAQPERGYGELSYSPERDLGLESGTYYLQLSTQGRQSALVISNEEQQALSGAQANRLYQAVQALLAQ